MTLIRDSSIRVRPPEQTLAIAKSLAKQLGISRVTDISPLDRIGIPVYASINPSLKVDKIAYGKGMAHIDAQVGAYMESIELAIAQDIDHSEVNSHWGTPMEIEGAHQKPDVILDFCTLVNVEVLLDQPILLADVENTATGEIVKLPAELVYFPLEHPGQFVFGSSTNGLASGNSVIEASVHALTEVIERDIWSFQTIKPSAIKVDLSSLPPSSASAVLKIRAAGFELLLRYTENEFQAAFFSAHLWHPDHICDKFFNGGWGCHLHKHIALNRAICEAVQGRAAMIHGGRATTHSIEHNPVLQTEIARINAADLPTISYGDIPDSPLETLEQQWQSLTRNVQKVTRKPIYRAVFTPADYPVQVVRVIAPKLENFSPDMIRIGRRLKSALEVQA